MGANSVAYWSFAYAALLMVWGSMAIAHYASVDPRERFWVALAAVALNLGLVSVGTSLISQMRPPVWLLAQCLVFMATAGMLRLREGASFSMSAPVGVAASRLVAGGKALLRLRSWQACAGLVLGALVLAFVGLSCMQQFLTPIVGGDERMYHASRVLYWIQHQDVFPYLTHNDRQNVFSFGSELIFLFPVLFTRSELVGKMVFWLGYPVALVGMLLLLRELGVKRTASLAGLVLFASTPLVMRYSVGLKGEIWLAVFVLGTAFWTVRACGQSIRVNRELVFAALFAVLSIDVKYTAVVLLPAIALLPWLVGRRRDWRKNGGAILAGGLVAFLLSGLAVTVGSNVIAYGRALGPQAMQQVHRAALSPRQLYTHLVRLPFMLLELPAVPSALVREQITDLGNNVIRAVGADAPLPLEGQVGWPGSYAYDLPKYGDKYSIGGMLWLPVLAVGAYGLVGDLRGLHAGGRVRAQSVLAALSLGLLAGSVLIVRWMAHSGIPERFVVAAYSLGVTLAVVLLAKKVEAHRWANLLAAVMLAYAVYSPVHLQVQRIQALRSSPIPTAWLDAPFAPALEHIESGSSILLVGSQGVTDYPLFGPREGYTNRVTSWGK